MESRESQVDFRKYIKILKSITLSVQVMPFVYSVFYIAAFVLSLYLPDDILSIVDTLFYISPLFTISHLFYSRVLHLCAYHRAACLVPVMPQMINLIDRIFPLSTFGAIAFNITAAIMVCTLLISAYNVFFK